MSWLIMKFAVAAMLVAGTLGVTAANADLYYGPTRNGDQCFVKAKGWSQMSFGSWQPCPKAAVAVHRVHHHNPDHAKAG